MGRKSHWMSLYARCSNITGSCCTLGGQQTKILDQVFIPIYDPTSMFLSRIKFAMTSLMLAFLILSSSHEMLERFELIHHEESHAHAHAHGEEHPGTNHELADGKCLAASGRKVSDCLFLDFAFIKASLLPDPELITPCPSFDLLTLPPPELSASWRFSCRTAIGIRAPSQIS